MRLKEIRKSAKKTQQEVADVLGIPLRTYQNYEREIHDPDTDVICKLADYYGVTLDYLAGRVNQDPNSEHELLRLFSLLDDRGKQKLLEYADDMVCSGKYAKKDVQNNSVSAKASA